MNRFKPDTAKRPNSNYIVSEDADLRPYGLLIKKL